MLEYFHGIPNRSVLVPCLSGISRWQLILTLHWRTSSGVWSTRDWKVSSDNNICLIALWLEKDCDTMWYCWREHKLVIMMFHPRKASWSQNQHLIPTASLQRGKSLQQNECPGYDIKLSNGEVSGMPELWGMRSTLSMPSLPGWLWP